MEDDAIIISNINDFIFCPVSIYFHNLYGRQAIETYKCQDQILGTEAHKTVNNSSYSSSSKILQGINCYCEKYNLRGKIDLFDTVNGVLTERKRTIKTVYNGYIFQLYAQYFALSEMGYEVKKHRLYSYTDNKVYPQKLPEDNPEMLKMFEATIMAMRSFQIETFVQENKLKCKTCIYEPACDRSLL